VDFVCRVLTPYYTEEVLFSLHDLDSPNEDGVSILFYLQKIFPGSSLTPNLCCINVKLREMRNVKRLLFPFWLLMHR
jgi:hypothetical protein